MEWAPKFAEVGTVVIDNSSAWRMDPTKKLVIFSDGLDVEEIERLYGQFHGRVKVSFGWGTMLTNDFRGLVPGDGLAPFSLVCKAVSANGRPTVKLSDNPAKAMGPADEIARYKRHLVLREVGGQGQRGRGGHDLRTPEVLHHLGQQLAVVGQQLHAQRQAVGAPEPDVARLRPGLGAGHRPLAAEVARIDVTTRDREAMPLLRYHTGDIVQKFPTGFRLLGREGNLYFRADGSLLSPTDIDAAMAR